MGKLTYDSTLTVDIDDRVLAHLQVVIGAKLRRGESFPFTWKDDPSVGSGRTTIWMHPALPLGFRYYDSQSPILNKAWIEALMNSANSSAGLQLVPEPERVQEPTRIPGPARLPEPARIPEPTRLREPARR